MRGLARFVIDPLQQAVVLCVGEKSGNEKLLLAEAVYQCYLQEISP